MYCDCGKRLGCAKCQRDIIEGRIPGFTEAEIQAVLEERARMEREDLDEFGEDHDK